MNKKTDGSIELPDYKIVIPNEIYEREKIGHFKNGRVDYGKELVFLHSAHDPSQVEVANHIRDRIRNLNRNPPRSNLEYNLSLFPKDLVDHLNECDGCLNSSQEWIGGDFLYVTQVFFPSEIVDKINEGSQRNNYLELMNNFSNIIEPLKMNIGYDHLNGLPKKEIITTLINNMTSGSKNFNVNTLQYNINEMHKLVNNLYHNITLNKINLLPDFSSYFLENRALDIVNEIQMRSVRQGLESIAEEFLNDLKPKSKYLH